MIILIIRHRGVLTYSQLQFNHLFDISMVFIMRLSFDFKYFGLQIRGNGLHELFAQF